MSELNEFDPVSFSHEENKWLLENLDKPPLVALRGIRVERVAITDRKGRLSEDIRYPDGINPKSVRPLLERIQELTDLQTHDGIAWKGVEAIKQAILVYLREDAKWEENHRRNPLRYPRFPSLSSYDSKGRPHLGGPGSDAGQVRTYILPDGSRRRFAVSLLADAEEYIAPVFTEQGEPELFEDGALCRFECRVPVQETDGSVHYCGHTESWRDGSRSSRAAARARMSKHLRKPLKETEKHMEVYTAEFGGVRK